MPLLNKVRFVHLEYNYGRNVISDKILEIDGISTLLKMENGGGKSVMTQMLLAPYIPTRLRNFPKRPFADYFRDTKPAFIVQEWLKDAGAGKFCIGLMASRKINPDLDSQEKINLYTWIAEYDKDVEFSLDNLELVDLQTNGRRAYKSFQSSKTMLENFAKSNPNRFALYNLTNSSSRQVYLSKLEELGIDQGEWIQMRQFNLEESGLAKFCETYDTEIKLLREVLIPAAAAKIDKETNMEEVNHVAHFQAMTTEFVELQAKNKENLKSLGELMEFQGKLNNFFTQSLSLRDEYIDLKATGDQIDAFARGISNALTSFSREDETLDALIIQAKKDLAHLEYEKLSKEWYSYDTKHQTLQGESEKIASEIKRIQDETAALEHYQGQLACADKYQKIIEYESAYQEYSEKAKSAQLPHEEITKKRDSYGSKLYALYSMQLEEETKQVETSEVQKNELLSEQKELTNKQKTLNQSVNTLTSEHAVYQSKIDVFFNEENNFLEKNNLEITHSLSWTDDYKLYDAITKQLEQNANNAKASYEVLQEQIVKLKLQKNNLNQQIQQNKLDKLSLDNQIIVTKEKLTAARKALKNRKQLSLKLGVEPNKLWDANLMDHRYQSQIALHEAHEEQAMSDITRCKNELENMQTGTSLSLSNEMKDVFAKLGVDYITGAMWLRQSPMPPKKKEKLVQEYPYFPYALIMDEEQSAKILEEFSTRNLYASEPIFLCSREVLSNPSKIDFGHLSTYLHFNTNLIFPSKLEEMSKILQDKKIGYETLLSTYRRTKKELEEDWNIVKTEGLSQEELERLETEYDILQQNKEDLIEAQANLTFQLEQCRKIINDLMMKSDDAKTFWNDENVLLDGWKTICTKFKQATKDFELQIQTRAKLTQTLSDLDNTDKMLLGMLNRLMEADRLLQNAKQAKINTFNQVGAFEYFKDFEPAKGTINELRARFDSLSAELQSSEYGIYVAERDKAQSKLKAAKEQLKIQEKRYGFQEEDWNNIPYSFEAEQETYDQIKANKKKIDHLTQKNLKLEKDISKLEGQIETLENHMEETCGTRVPLEAKECRQGDLGSLIQKAKEDQDTLTISKDELKTKTTHFEQVLGSVRAEANEVSSLTRFVQIPTDETDNIVHFEAIDVQKWTTEKLDNEHTALITSSHHRQSTAQKMNNDLSLAITKVKEEYRKKMAICFQLLESILPLLVNPYALPDELKLKQKLLQNLIDKTEEDLKLLKDNRHALINTLMDYMSLLHQNLKAIDQDTTIEIGNVTRKMLSIEVKEWDEIEPGVKGKMEEYLDQLLVAIEKNPENQIPLIKQNIYAPALYENLIGIVNIPIRLYKIEENNQVKIAWHEAGKLSGAEGFLCAFVVVSALLNFQRKDHFFAIYGKRSGHVLLLDNPFAYVQSGHIIQALVNLCKVTNTQLVAFSNVGNAEVLNAFKNIYTLRLITNFDEKNHLDVVHTRVPQEHQNSSVEPVQIRIYDRNEQLSLFKNEENE